MCGRVVQSRNAIQMGTSLLLGDQPSSHGHPTDTTSIPVEYTDNWNLAPGMKSVVFILDEPTDLHSKSSSIQISPQMKVWGVIPKSGTIESPLPSGPNKHFAHLMYNARSETLYEKKTFRDLALKGNVCAYFTRILFCFEIRLI